MIERKTRYADLDRHRPLLFLASAMILFIIFFLIPNFSIRIDTEKIMEKIMEDMSVDIELPPLPKSDENVVAAVTDMKERSNRLNKVDDVTTPVEEELSDVMEFQQIHSAEAEELQEDEAAIVPPEAEKNMKDMPLRTLEELPEFPGGMTEFVKWLTNALRYPEKAKKAHTQGIVKISFVVEKDGSVTGIKLLTPTKTVLDDEVMRVLNMMPKWKPATEKGKPCRSVVAIPFVFAM